MPLVRAWLIYTCPGHQRYELFAGSGILCSTFIIVRYDTVGVHRHFPTQVNDDSPLVVSQVGKDATYNMLEHVTGHSWCPSPNSAIFIHKSADIARVTLEPS